MNKPIAERFDEYTFEVEQSMFHETEIINWLKQQPENNKTFSLEEVEQIAREAVECTDQDFDSIGEPPREKGICVGFVFSEDWWAKKKKELMK